MWPIAIFQHRQTQVHHCRYARATNNTRATWPPAPSSADLAVILIDARHGVLTQTRRHSFIVSLLGIRHVVVTVNKMDLVDFSQERFEQICDDYRALRRAAWICPTCTSFLSARSTATTSSIRVPACRGIAAAR